MASLLDLGKKLKDTLWSATPFGQTYNAVQTAVPKFQQAIQGFGEKNTRAAGVMLKAEPAYNAIQGAIRSIPAAPFQFRMNTGNPLADIPTNIGLGIVQAPLNMPTGVLKGLYEFPQAKNRQEALGSAAGIVNNLMAGAIPKAIPGQISNVVRQPRFLTPIQRIGSSIVQGAKTGSQFGALGGALTGIESAKNLPDPKEYVKSLLSNTATGVVAGGAIGGALGGITGTMQQTKQLIQGKAKTQAVSHAYRIANAEERNRPKWARGLTQDQIEKKLFDYYKTQYSQGGFVDAGEFKAPYKRGDQSKLEGYLDEILGTDSFMNGKWNSRLPARQKAYEQIRYYAEQGDEQAKALLEQADELYKQIDIAKAAKQSVSPSNIKSSSKFVPSKTEKNLGMEGGATPLPLSQNKGVVGQRRGLQETNVLEKNARGQIPQGQLGIIPPKLAKNEATPAKTLARTIAQTARGGKLKERQFITTVKESGKTAEPVKQMVEGFYVPKSNDTLSRAAQRQIKNDINTARQRALTELNDEAVAIANELVSHYSAQGDYDSAAYVANTVAENLTEAGRAVQAASLYDKLTPEGIQRYAASELNKVRMQLKPEDAKRLYDLAASIQKLPAGTNKAVAQQKLMEEVANLIPTPLVTKLTSLWKAGLLTGLKTTGRNITSNAINNVSEVVKDVPATMVDMMASLFTGKRTKVFTIKGVAPGLAEGVKKGAQFLITGFDERKQMGKLDTRYVNWGKSIIGKAAKAYTDTVFRFLGAQDQPFYYAALRRSLNDQAAAKAITAGRRGDSAFIRNLINSPTEDMIRTSVLDAERAVFQNKTAAGQAISKAKVAFNKQSPLAGAVADFVAPFTGVPAAVAEQVANYTPVGLAKTIIENIGSGKFDQRQFSEGIGRGLTGTGIMAIGSALMSKGLMTLDRPTGEKERQQWELEGKQPFSILYNGKWRSIGSLGPQAQVLLIGGYLQNGGAGQAILGGLKSQKEQTFLKGISSLTEAIDNPRGYAQGYAESAAGSLVPTFVANVAQATDPYLRETNSIPEAIKARLPGQREDLIKRRDAFGDPLRNTQGFIGSMIDIFNSSPVKSGLIVNELRRLSDLGHNVTPSKIDKVQSVSGEKVELTASLQDVLESTAGPAVKQVWEEVVQSKEYKALSDDNKAKLLQNLLESIRKVEKLGVTAKVNPEASAEALLDLTKNERTYLTTGTLPYKLPKEKQINQLTPEQINMATDILTGNDPDKATKLAELIAQTSKPKKPRKITIKRVSPKTIRVSLPKAKKPATLRIAAPPKPKQSGKVRKTAVFKIKPIKTKKLIGLTAGKKLV